MKNVCFFVKIESEEYLERVGFYKQDISILKDLGYRVYTSIKIKDISWNADVYYVWWWTWAFIPVFISLIRRKPIIITGVFDHYINNEPVDFYNRNIIHKLLIKFALKFATANILISKLEMINIKKNFDVSNPYLVPLSIDCVKYKQNLNIKRKRNLLLTISWLSKENVIRKRIIQIIQAISLVKLDYPSIELHIVGKEGDGINEIHELIKNLDLSNNIFVIGPISEELKIKYLQECSIYVQPTLVEGFGLAILEAMSCGAPIISSQTGTVPEVMSDNGLYVDPCSIEEIADAIIFLLGNTDVAGKIGDSAAIRAINFSYDSRLIAMNKILKEIVR